MQHCTICYNLQHNTMYITLWTSFCFSNNWLLVKDLFLQMHHHHHHTTISIDDYTNHAADDDGNGNDDTAVRKEEKLNRGL